MPMVWPSCAIHLLSCLEQSSLDVVPAILSGPISYTCRCAHMQVEDLLEMTAIGYWNGMILAILNLCLTVMPPIKFQLNWTYGLGGDVV